jgi:hypothetical protein
MSPGKVLEGYVDNGRGAPLPGISAIVTRITDGAIVTSGITGPDGRWEFSGLAETEEYFVNLADGAGNAVVRAPWSGELRTAWIRDRLALPDTGTAILPNGGNTLVGTLPLMLDPNPANVIEWGPTGLFSAGAEGLTEAAADLLYEPLDSAYTKAEADALFLTAAEADALFLTPAEANALYEPFDSAYTKAEADARYTQGGITQAAADLRYEPLDSAYTKSEADARYEPLDSAYTKAEDDARFVNLAGGSVMTGLLGPTTTNTRDLGTTTLRWRKLWGVDADLSGTLIAAGTVGIGTITSPSALLHIGANASYSGVILDYASSLDPYTADLRFRRARNTLASPQIVASGDNLGSVQFWGYDGGAYRPAATIVAEVGAAPGASDMPGALTFNTTTDGAITPTERLRINAAGLVTIASALQVNSRPVIMAGVRVTRAANQTITTGTNTVLAFTAERYDTDAFHDNVTNNSRLTVQAGHAGKYVIWAAVLWNAVADATYRQVSFRVNGTTVIVLVGGPGMNSASFGTAQNPSCVHDLAAGDYVECLVQHERGSNLDVLFAASFTPEFGMQRIG